MKISTLEMLLLVISGIFFIYGEMVREANMTFSTDDSFTNINSSEWDNEYDLVNSINNTIAPLEEKFRDIQDPETGFFTKLYLGISAIPYAIILVPQTLFNALYLTGTIIVGFADVLNIPAYIVGLVIVMVLCWGLFKLLEYFQKTPI